MSLPRLSTVSVRQHAVLGCADLLLAQLDDPVVEVADVLAQTLDLLLHIDHGHVGDDAERGVEQVADFLLAVLLGLRPQRLHQEVPLGGKLPGLAAVLGRVLQNAFHRAHQPLRLLVARVALARVLLRDGESLDRWRRFGCTPGFGGLGLRHLNAGVCARHISPRWASFGPCDRRSNDQAQGDDRERTPHGQHGTASPVQLPMIWAMNFRHFRV
jgi:hypothetical protein